MTTDQGVTFFHEHKMKQTGAIIQRNCQIWRNRRANVGHYAQSVANIQEIGNLLAELVKLRSVLTNEIEMLTAEGAMTDLMSRSLKRAREISRDTGELIEILNEFGVVNPGQATCEAT